MMHTSTSVGVVLVASLASLVSDVQLSVRLVISFLSSPAKLHVDPLVLAMHYRGRSKAYEAGSLVQAHLRAHTPTQG